MAHYIDKDALVAEIDQRLHQLTDAAFDSVIGRNLIEIKKFINTIEVKEVDLDEEIEKCLKQHNMLALGKKDFTNIAKHFFELGLQASSSLTWEDMMTIHKCCKDAMNYNLYAWETAEGQQKIYEEVLKQFKDFRERKEK